MFLENVPGIKPYIPQITADLTEDGYLGCYGFFSATGCGAPHRRIRWFLLAYTKLNGQRQPQEQTDASGDRRETRLGSQKCGNRRGQSATQKDVADTSSQRTRMERQDSFDERRKDTDSSQSEILRQRNGTIDAEGINSSGENMAYAEGGNSRKSNQEQGRKDISSRSQDVSDAESIRHRGRDSQKCGVKRWEFQQEKSKGSAVRSETERCDWWSVEPDVGRVAHGVPDRVDRLRALGNAVVPIVAAKAWRILLASLFEAGIIDV